MRDKRDREHEPGSEWQKEREQEQFMISLYENYRDYMFYVARQFVEDVHACEDIVQDGIVKLLRRIEMLQSLEEKALITYLYKTIKNLALDYLDERMKERATPPEDMEGVFGAPSEPGAAEQAANPEEMMAAAADGERIQRAWSGLTEEERFLLAHKYYYGESGEELAQATGIRRDFISMKLIRAKKKLAKLLQEDAGDEEGKATKKKRKKATEIDSEKTARKATEIDSEKETKEEAEIGSEKAAKEGTEKDTEKEAKEGTEKDTEKEAKKEAEKDTEKEPEKDMEEETKEEIEKDTEKEAKEDTEKELRKEREGG